uniref:serpin-Z10-like n=1 Tax=Erigeron canadensis TaxID=72917 RepID=UPI001CB918A8|nr:serpin-Z10-like [Erigeron canadensis]
MLLGMLAAGAEGKTLEQLLEFLGHESIDQFLSESPSVKLLARLLSDQSRGAGKGPEIDLFSKWFMEVLKSVYKTEVEFMDFKEEAVSKINSWVDEKTRGLIPRIINREALKGDQVITLVNALYFKGMCSKEFYYGSFEGYKILQIPYEGEGRSMNRFSMYMFLPYRKDGLQELLQVFHSNPALFCTWFYLEPHYMEKLLIPKFKITNEFDVGNVVKQMGLTLPFESTNIEFSRMVEPSVYGDHVYVSKILQKSFIDV